MTTIATIDRQGSGRGGMLAALVVALALHAAALLGMIYLRFTPLAPPGEQQISIDLAPQMAEAETQAADEQMRVEEVPEEAKPEGEPAEAKPVETAEAPVEKPPEEVVPPPPTEVTEVTPEEVKPPPPPEVAEVKPDEPEVPPPPPQVVTETPPEVVPPPPEERIITSEAPEAEPLAPPPPTVAKTEPPPPDPKKLEAQREAQRKAKLEARREAERRKEIKELAVRREQQRREDLEKKREAARRTQQAVAGNAQRNSRSSSRQAATGSGSAGNDPNAMAAWKAAIAASIRGRMNRNAAAGTSGGVATVRFTVSRSGAVSGAGLAGSSGVGAIDSAALAAVRGSMPPAPAGFGGSSLSVTVPLRFSPGG